MNSHIEKSQESKNQSLAYPFVQKQNHRASAFQFANNRPDALVQKTVQRLAKNSPQATQLRVMQNMANHYAHERMTAQLQAISSPGATHPIQKQPFEDEDELQMKAAPIQQKSSPALGRRDNNTGLPDSLKSGIEILSGVAMDDVYVHYNSPKPAQLNALAYAQGSDIHVSPGQERHLPHEAWHVTQQKQGRVKPTLQLQGVAINDEDGLEKESDVMGAKALQMRIHRD